MEEELSPNTGMASILANISDKNAKMLSPATLEEIRQHRDDLTKLSRNANLELQQALRKTKQDKIPEIAEQERYTEELKATPIDISTPEAYGRGVVSGLTLGTYGPQVSAGITAAAKSAFGPKTYEQVYKEELPVQKQLLEESKLAHPTATGVGGFVGSMAPAAGVGKVVGGVFPAASKTLQNIIGGAALGGVPEYIKREDLPTLQRIVESLKAGGYGAAAGYLFPKAAERMSEIGGYGTALIPGATQVAGKAIEPFSPEALAKRTAGVATAIAGRDKTMTDMQRALYREAVESPQQRQMAFGFDPEAEAVAFRAKVPEIRKKLNKSVSESFKDQQELAKRNIDPKEMSDAVMMTNEIMNRALDDLADIRRASYYSPQTRKILDNTMQIFNEGIAPRGFQDIASKEHILGLPKTTKFDRAFTARKYLDDAMQDKGFWAEGNPPTPDKGLLGEIRNALTAIVRTSPEKQIADKFYSTYVDLDKRFFEPFTYFNPSTEKIYYRTRDMVDIIGTQKGRAQDVLEALPEFEKFLSDNKNSIQNYGEIKDFVDSLKLARQKAEWVERMGGKVSTKGPRPAEMPKGNIWTALGLPLRLAASAVPERMMPAGMRNLSIAADPQGYLNALDKSALWARSLGQNKISSLIGKLSGDLKIYVKQNPNVSTEFMIRYLKSKGLPDEFFPVIPKTEDKNQPNLPELPTPRPGEQP